MTGAAVLVALASVLVSCSRTGFGSGDSASPAGALTPVDCTHLCPAPEKLAEDATQSDAVRLRADLPAGTGQVLLGWNDGEGDQWFFPTPTDDALMLFDEGGDDLPVWDIRIEIPCVPESTVSVQITRDGEPAPLTPGTYPLVSVGFDVPEQGLDSDSRELSGEVVIASINDGLVSGYMQGRGGGMLESATQEDPGLRYEVAAMHFEQIEGDFVASP